MVVSLALLFATLLSQVTLEVTPRSLPENGTLQLQIVVEGAQSGRNISLPKGLDGGPFQLLNRFPSTSSMTQIINGQVTQTQTYVYSFRPTRQGSLEFPGQTVEFLGKTYTSEAVSVEVGPPQAQVQRPRNRSLFDRDPFEEMFGRRRQMEEAEVFARAFTPRSSYFVGEAIPFALKLYTRGVLVDGPRSHVELPNFEGFWSEENPVKQTIALTESYQNKMYNVSVVDQRTLYASKPGKMVLEPAQFDLYVRAGDIFSDFSRVLRQTEPLELEILPLPTASRPDDFTGLVGQFALSAVLEPGETVVGGRLSLRIEVKGGGNFNAIADWKPEGLDPSLEFFDGGAPQTHHQEGVPSGRSWTYAIVPKREGVFEFPPLRRSYFDPASKSYRHMEAGPWTIKVGAGQQALLGGSTLGSGLVHIDLEKDLHYILEKPQLSPRQLPSLQPVRLLWFALAALGFNLLLLSGKRGMLLLNMRANSGRPNKAMKRFRSTLAQLQREAGKMEAEPFFSQLSAALYGYFGDRLQRPAQGISLDLLEEELTRRRAEPAIHRDLVELVEHCDLARFTPGSATSREKILEKARQVLERMEEVLA